MDIYSQLQQEVGAAGGELEPKTRAALMNRLDEVLRTLVTRYVPCEPQAGLEQTPGRKRAGAVGRAPGEGPLLLTFHCPPSSQLLPRGEAAPSGSENSDQVSGWSSIPAGPTVPGELCQVPAGQGRHGDGEAGEGAEQPPGTWGRSVSWGWRRPEKLGGLAPTGGREDRGMNDQGRRGGSNRCWNRVRGTS